MTAPVEIRQRIMSGLRSRVISDAVGAVELPFQRYSGHLPEARFWLGKLVPESRVLIATRSRDALERFQPAAHGFTFRVPALPVELRLRVSFALWLSLHPTFEEQQAGAGLEGDPAEYEDEIEAQGDRDNDRHLQRRENPGLRPPRPRRGDRHRQVAVRGIPLARVRMKVPIQEVQFALNVDAVGERTAGGQEIDRAIQEAIRRLPATAQAFRPRRRGGVLPREGDLRDRAAWASYASHELSEPAIPHWTVAVDVETMQVEADLFELTVLLTNRSPDIDQQFVDRDRTQNYPSKVVDPLIYEAQLSCEPSLTVIPYQLDQIPDSYRYDRNVHSLGMNTAVEVVGSEIRTAFAAIAQTNRIHPRTRTDSGQRIDTSFAALANDPIPAIESMLIEAGRWTEQHWGPRALNEMAVAGEWLPDTRERAEADATEVRQELNWLNRGLDLLRADPQLLRAFKLMNRTMEKVARERYHEWYPFQLAFIIGCLEGVREPAAAPLVDILWFSTGGGKTEAYLGLNVLALFYERLRGRTGGAQTWARFPLRLLSLQQTQRIAESILLAESIRKRELDLRDGEPFGVGYFVGADNTPNKISLPNDRFFQGWDPNLAANCESCRVLEICPVCRISRPRVFFDVGSHTMVHECTNDACELAGRLPVYVVDDDIYRWAPSVIVGTVDKLAQIGQQANFRVLLGQALSRCPVHGYSASPEWCARFGCQTVLQPVPVGFRGMNFEIQDELHLLNESLGALDGNYETLFQAIARENGIPSIRIIAATATIEGYKAQADHLYRRGTRRFPMPGPTRTESFWAVEKAGDPLRMYVATLARGTTMLNAAFFVTESHWKFVEEARRDPDRFTTQTLGLLPADAGAVLADLSDYYEVMVTYALRKLELERYAKDISESPLVCPSPTNYDSITGDVSDIRSVLARLEAPPAPSEERIRVLGATSAISHGVDINRLNVMTVMGMPKQTAEFIQATARVGRKEPAIVFALVNPMRIRDVSNFRYFQKYAEYLDRLLEAVPVNRESLPVLKRVLPGGLMALLLQVEEQRWLYPNGRPLRPRRTRLREITGFVNALDENFLTEPDIVRRLLEAFDVDPTDPRFAQHVAATEDFVNRNVTKLRLQQGSNRAVPDELEPTPPNSLRDVESQMDIVGEK